MPPRPAPPGGSTARPAALAPASGPRGPRHTDFDPAPYANFLAAFRAGRDGTGQGDEQTAKARAEAQGHRDALTHRLTDAVKLVAAQHLRDEPRAAAYFRVELLQAPEKKAKATA